MHAQMLVVNHVCGFLNEEWLHIEWLVISDEYVDSYSYDYSFNYPKCMCSDKLMIPNKPGKEYKLEQLPSLENLKVGYYRVKITCENDDFKKLFAFSKKILILTEVFIKQ